MQNNTPEERLTYQLCIEIINKIAKEYGDLNVPGILDPLIAQRIDLAIQDVLTKLEDLDGKTDIKLEDINKIKEDCQNIIATGNELSVSFNKAFTLLESIVAHVNDIESSTELKAQQIQTIKEAIEVLEQNINSLVDRAALIEKNIDNLYREFVKKYNHSVQIYEYILEWKEQIEHFIILAEPVLEELKTLIPQAQETNKKLEEAIAIGLDLEQVIKNAEQTIVEAGEEQASNITTTGENILESINTIKTEIETVTIPTANTTNEELTNVVNTGQDLINEISNKRNESLEAIHQKEIDSLKLIEDTDTLIKQGLINTAEDLTEKSVITIKAQETTSSNKFAEFVTDKITAFTKLFTDSTTAFTKLVADKTANFLLAIYPIKSTYTQYPNKTTGTFDETETPQALFGGDWELVDTKLFNNVPERVQGTDVNKDGYALKYPNRQYTEHLIYDTDYVYANSGTSKTITSILGMPFKDVCPYVMQTSGGNGDTSNPGVLAKYTPYYGSKIRLTNPTDSEAVVDKVFAVSKGYWKDPTDPISEEEEKNYVKIWKRINPPTEV